MTSQLRAALRGQANGLSPVVQLGKSGVTEQVEESFRKVLEARELIKLRVLETCPVGVRDAVEQLAASAGAEVVSVVGRTGVVYKYNPELHKKK
ncbi:MAG: YhbY family RNA-binding protein [Clostridia bacterium]|nr:YhbY family RNA-binding protein [Clostridia bacterium]